MTFGSPELGKFELVRLAALRTAQLMRGCHPRVPLSSKLTTTALREVTDGKVIGMPRLPADDEPGIRPVAAATTMA